VSPLDAHAADTLRAAAEVFVPGPPHDATLGAADLSADLFVSHYLDIALPGLAQAVCDLLDASARARFDARPFIELDLHERETILDEIATHEVEQLREVPQLLGLLSIAAIYGEWTGQDGDGELVRTPLGWELTGFEGPSRGRIDLLREP
jgi:hypothetical protein